jgi:hypothetical protein
MRDISRRADQQAEGLASRRPEFLLVDLVEEMALVEFDRPFQITAEFRPAKVENPDLDPRVCAGGTDETTQTTPGRLQRLKSRMVDYRIDLFGQQRVDQRDSAVDP